jgi:nitroreductase
MKFLDLVQLRQSDRAYDVDRIVENDKLTYILEAARLAPSACNAQPWTFIVVNDPETRKQVASAISDKTLGMNHFSYQAPVFIILVEESANLTSTLGGKIKQKHFPHIDLGIAAAHLSLAAADQGLGSCIIGWFNEKKICETLKIPASKRPVLVLTLGYSKQENRMKKRKQWDSVVRYNQYR